MPLTNDQIAATMNAAGIDTPEKLTALLSNAGKGIRRLQIDREVERLRAEAAASAQGFEAQIQALQREKREIEASL